MSCLAFSGAGKSTLLNVLNQRNVEDLDIQGNIFVNGCKINRNSFTSMSAYVQQDDIFIGLLKVKEQLWFQVSSGQSPFHGSVLGHPQQIFIFKQSTYYLDIST